MPRKQYVCQFHAQKPFGKLNCMHGWLPQSGDRLLGGSTNAHWTSIAIGNKNQNHIYRVNKHSIICIPSGPPWCLWVYLPGGLGGLTWRLLPLAGRIALLSSAPELSKHNRARWLGACQCRWPNNHRNEWIWLLNICTYLSVLESVANSTNQRAVTDLFFNLK